MSEESILREVCSCGRHFRHRTMASLNMDFLNTPAASAFPAGMGMGMDDMSNVGACVEGDNFVLPAGEDVSLLVPAGGPRFYLVWLDSFTIDTGPLSTYSNIT